MDGRRVGRILRAVRHHKRLRQVDVAALAGVGQSTVSRAELGRLGDLSFESVDGVARVLGVTLFLDGRWDGGDADRLVDRVHARVVEAVVAALEGPDWEVVVEYGFNHFGDRGSVDVLAWHAATQTLLIVEVKSRLTDLQATFASFSRKARLVPTLVAKERGWVPQHVGHLLVMPGSKLNRSLVARHAATFAKVFPERMPAIRSWLNRPDRSLGGIWFLSASQYVNVFQARRVNFSPE